MAWVTGTCFFCKEPSRRRRTVSLPGNMARSLFPAWDAEVAFPARVCSACLRARPELRALVDDAVQIEEHAARRATA